MAIKSGQIHGNTSNGPSDDPGELIAITGGFAFAVATCLAIRDAVAAETSVSTLLPFLAATILLVVGIGMQKLRKSGAASS